MKEGALLVERVKENFGVRMKINLISFMLKVRDSEAKIEEAKEFGCASA
jgi:hypothetical protein